MDLLQVIAQQIPQKLAFYVSIAIDVKEGLYFDKYTGILVGYADLGEITIFC